MKTREQVSRDFEALFFNVPPALSAPTIKEQPEDLTVDVGQKAFFSVTVMGVGPFTYQWRKNGRLFPEIASTLNVCEFSVALPGLEDNSAKFDVIVGNAAGSITSNAATLTVKESEAQTKKRVIGGGIANCSVEDIVRIMQIPPAVVEEAKKVEAQRLAGTFDYAAQYKKIEEESRFQRCAFANGIRDFNPSAPSGKARNKNKLTSRGMDEYGHPNDDIATLYNGLNEGTGLSVMRIPGDPAALGIRKETPEWMLKPEALRRFLHWHVSTKTNKEPSSDKERLTKAAGLDFVILRDYYLWRLEDKVIFETYKARFCRERDRQRKTKSTEAVKMRRVRLVSAGNTLFAAAVPKTPNASPKAAEEGHSKIG